MTDLKPVLRKVGTAALSGMTDAQIRRDPAKAVLIAQAAMRGALNAMKDTQP